MTKRKIVPNCKKGNQHAIDPRQSLFLANYINPKSKTFGNAFQSALKAGYSKDYSENITKMSPAWLPEALKKVDMLSKAVRNLDEMLDMETIAPAFSMMGKPLIMPDGQPVMKRNTEILKVKADISKFVAERIGRKDFGKDKEDGGGDITNNFVQININAPAKRADA